MSPAKPRRRMVEQAPTWAKAQRPEDMIGIVQRWVGEDPPRRELARDVVLGWIAQAGDVHSATLARLVLGLDEHGNDPEA